jgi:hypothetical protein
MMTEGKAMKGTVIEFPGNRMNRTDLHQAFRDWVMHKAYWSQHGYTKGKGNYRLSHNPRQMAPWNKLVKRTFADVAAFHNAANAYVEGRLSA